GRDAVEIARVVDLWELQELAPRQHERILDFAGDLELPRVQRHLGLLAEVEDGPIPDLVLAHRQLRHAVSVRRAAALGPFARELHVDGALIERDLPLDEALPPFYQVRDVGHGPILTRRLR